MENSIKILFLKEEKLILLKKVVNIIFLTNNKLY